MKAFQYVNPANEREAVAALGTERNRILPMAGGMDLLGLMKDYIVSPERVVNLKGLDGTITADGNRQPADERRGASGQTEGGGRADPASR